MLSVVHPQMLSLHQGAFAEGTGDRQPSIRVEVHLGGVQARRAETKNDKLNEEMATLQWQCCKLSLEVHLGVCR